MRRERQDHESGQSLSDRVALCASQFDGCAYKIGAALRIDDETMDLAPRKKQEGRFIEPQVALAVLHQCEFATLEEMQVAHLGVLHRLAQRTREEGPGPRRGVGKEGGERVHWDDRQCPW